MSNLSVVTGNADPILVLSATGTGPSATTFVHDSGAENNYPGQLFPSVFEFAITDIVGPFASLQINLEWSPITASGTPQFQTIGTWAPLTSPTAFFPCSATGSYRLNCTAFSGGTSFNVYASIASSMPQGSGGGGGGGSVTQGTVPWIDNIVQVAGVALGATAVVAYGSTPAAANVPGVNAFITNAGSIGGGTQYADNVASGATPTGVLDMGWDSVNSKVRALKVDASQNLLVALNTPLPAGTAVIGHVIVDSGAVDVTDRAARLLGVVYGSQAQQLKQTAINFNLQVELATAGTLYDARQIRALTSADVITSAQGTAAALAGAWPVKVTDGTNTMPTGDAAARTIHTTIDNASVAVSFTVPQHIIVDSGSITANQGSPNTLANKWPVQVTDGTNTMPTGDAIARALFHEITDGTNGPVAVKAASTAAVAADPALVIAASPNGRFRMADGAGNPLTTNGTSTGIGVNPLDSNILSILDTQPTQAGYLDVKISDGSHGTAAVKAASITALATDPALVVSLSPNSPISLMVGGGSVKWTGLNLAGLNPGHVALIDSSGSGTIPAIKAASTAAVATDPALVVALSPNSNSVSISGASIVQPTIESSSMKDILTQMLLALDAVNMNLGRLMAGDPMSRQELANSNSEF